MGSAHIRDGALLNGEIAASRSIHLFALACGRILGIVRILIHVNDGHRNQICIPESIESQICVDRCGEIKLHIFFLIRRPAAEGITLSGGLAAGGGVALGNDLGRHCRTAVCNEADSHRVCIPCVQVQCFTICTLVSCIADRGIKIESVQVSRRAIPLHGGRPALEYLAHQCGTLGRCYSFPRHCGKGQVYGLAILAVEVDVVDTFRFGLHPLCIEYSICGDRSFGGEFRGQCFIRIPAGEDLCRLSIFVNPAQHRQIRNRLTFRNRNRAWHGDTSRRSLLSYREGHGIFRRSNNFHFNSFSVSLPSPIKTIPAVGSIIGMCNRCGSRRNTGDGGSFVVFTQSKINGCYSLLVTCPGFLMIRIR